ncbi:MAG TPA: FAD/NAD(P)-binding oxidoreductase [Solirubrobacteraceae bacterium]|jgi:sulfide:quinone oxidoreductase|nr:FAD/NAD(P)-binding oxidoreductase [Solirubrobacteraceae bacterium]
MSADDSQGERFKVVIAGGGVAALEAALALHDLAGELVSTTIVAPKPEFVYRPLLVREPFTPAVTTSYSLAEIAERAGAELLVESFRWLDPRGRMLHTDHGRQLSYDAVLLAIGARTHPRFRDVLTLDDTRLHDQLADFVASIETGKLKSVAFVVPSLPIWSLPAYELALMTANRAHARGHDISVLLVTPEDSPLAALGINASAEVAELLGESGITTITSATCQIRERGRIDVYPLRSSILVDQIISLPELYAPSLPGVPTSAERGFVTVDSHGAVHGLSCVYAAGDITETPVKHAGLSADQADVAAQAIAALAGAPLEPRPLRPALHVMLLGAAKPLFIRSQMLGEHGVDLELSNDPPWQPAEKLHTEYLGPVLADLDAARAGP